MQMKAANTAVRCLRCLPEPDGCKARGGRVVGPTQRRATMQTPALAAARRDGAAAARGVVARRLQWINTAAQLASSPASPTASVASIALPC